MGNSGSEQAPTTPQPSTKEGNDLQTTPQPAVKHVEQKVEATNGKHAQRNSERVDSAGAQKVPATVLPEDSAAAGLTLTRPNRMPPQPLEESSEEGSSEEDDDDKTGTWITTSVELGPDGLPSIGSAGHSAGDCKRCCFFPKGRCSNGHDCTFCHFDHEKRKRLKKKKKRSENPTPSNLTPSDSYLAGMPILLTSPTDQHGFSFFHPSTPLAVNSPSGDISHGALLSPMSPGAPPLLPPSLDGIKENEPPPPPAEEALPDVVGCTENRENDEQRALCMRACAVELASGLLPTSPNKMIPPGPPVEPPDTPPKAIASSSIDSKDLRPPSLDPLAQASPQSPSGTPSSPSAVTGSATTIAGTPVTLTELFSGSSHPQNSNPPATGTSVSTNLVPASADLPLWPPQVTSIPVPPHASTNLSYWSPTSWQEYSANQVLDWSSYSQSYGAGVDGLGLLTATLPPPLPGVAPSAFGGYSSIAQVPSGGLQHDSPRSAVLTLCGAWGALKNPRTDQLSKSDLLAYRGVLPKGSRPKPLRSLRIQYV
mmetsp:Transcript_100741/g.157315  ORF Transcript_100741/g.157315 Transcript_100741/m.157315 type:complete len:539 (+) Transcript_100741:65-1681(+)